MKELDFKNLAILFDEVEERLTEEKRMLHLPILDGFREAIENALKKFRDKSHSIEAIYREYEEAIYALDHSSLISLSSEINSL